MASQNTPSDLPPPYEPGPHAFAATNSAQSTRPSAAPGKQSSSYAHTRQPSQYSQAGSSSHQSSTPAGPSTATAGANVSASASASASTSTTSSSFIAHGILGLYHTSHSDLQIAASADSSPLYYIGTHGVFSSKADLTLHCRPTPTTSASATSPIIAEADFDTFTGVTTIQLFTPDAEKRLIGGVALKQSGFLSHSHAFAVRLPDTGSVETFTWRHVSSSAPHVLALAGGRGAMECVSGHGEIVAVFVGPAGPSARKLGKVRFMARRGGGMAVGPQGEAVRLADEGWGEGVEGMVLMALLSVKEKERRRRNRRRHMAT